MGHRASAAGALRAVSQAWGRDPEGAVRDLARALAQVEEAADAATPEVARMRARLGQLLGYLGRLDEAVRVLRDGLELADDPYLQLQLGAALAWRGDEASRGEARDRFALALRAARTMHVGPLAIAALCGEGELRLTEGRGREAVFAFGEALGISEFSSGDAPSVLPLAGLARAHRRWRAPAKAAALARRAVARAERAGDPALRAWAAWALAEASNDGNGLAAASALARAAPHRPLAIRLARLHLESAPDEAARASLAREAQACGMVHDARLLEGGDANGT